MHEDLQYLRERVDSIADVLTRNTVVLEQNTDSLKEHMKQTGLIARRVQLLEETGKFMKWLGVIIACLSTAVGAILGISQLLH